MCGETPTDLRVGTPMPTRNLVGLPLTRLIETQRKASINSPFQSGENARNLEDWLEAQPHRYFCLVIRFIRTTQLSGLLHSFLDT
jgi:hypothetical protein